MKEYAPHQTTSSTCPSRMRRSSAVIDEGIAELIRHLWRLGFTTRFCCQGRDLGIGG